MGDGRNVGAQPKWRFHSKVGKKHLLEAVEGTRVCQPRQRSNFFHRSRLQVAGPQYVEHSTRMSSLYHVKVNEKVHMH